MPADGDYLFDGGGTADPDVARLEAQLAPLRFDPSATPLRTVRRSRRPYYAGGAALAAAIACGVLVWTRSTSGPCGAQGGGFAFSAAGGDVTCGDTALASGTLPVGGTLDTGAHEADLHIASIGLARLGAGTRVRLDATSTGGHHLSLEHGHLHARVDAPPRLFAVTTSAAEVTDLGCEYELAIDDAGAGSLHVLSGKVELATASATIVVVPAGTHAALLPGRRPGLPVIDAPDAGVAAAATALESAPSDPAALAKLLTAATPRDAITLVTVAALERDAERRRTVLARLQELSPAPSRLTLDDVTDPAIFELWRDDVVLQLQTHRIR